MVGRRLAARVLKTWVEDFVDEDTGEVISERTEHELVFPAEHVLSEEDYDKAKLNKNINENNEINMLNDLKINLNDI